MKNAVIFLMGLPGAGISTIQQALKVDYSLKTQDFSQILNAEALKTSNFSKNAQAWVILDISQKIPPNWALGWLKQAVLACDLIIYNRVEASDIECQMQWQNVLTAWRKALPPIIRFQNQTFPRQFLQKWPEASNFSELKEALTPLQWALERVEYEVNALNVEFFWQGIEAGVQNLGMQIYRITGRVQALDYEHPVLIEGTASGLSIYTSEIFDSKLIVLGKHLNKDFIREIILQKT